MRDGWYIIVSMKRCGTLAAKTGISGVFKMTLWTFFTHFYLLLSGKRIPLHKIRVNLKERHEIAYYPKLRTSTEKPENSLKFVDRLSYWNIILVIQPLCTSGANVQTSDDYASRPTAVPIASEEQKQAARDIHNLG